MEKETLQLRMYFFVNYQLIGIQKGIQAGHSALRYVRTYHNENPLIWDFIDNHETWIILDGGTTNNRYDFEGKPLGSMNEILESLQQNEIEYGYFQEPDLNDALTAICFICDERVFNRKDYPDFQDYVMNRIGLISAESRLKMRMLSITEIKEGYMDLYKEWIRFIGGVKNEFLRELIKDKKLA